MKRNTLILIFVIVSAFAFSQEKKPRIGIVLGGGGAKGFVHIGVLKVLKEEGVPIDIIVGNSIGSIMGGLTAVGYTPSELEAMAHAQDWEMLLSDAAPRTYMSEIKQLRKKRYILELPLTGKEKKKLTVPLGAVKGQNVLNVFNSMLANVPDSVNFDSLPIPYACIGTSLLTGNEVDIHSGHLPTAILSSMCVPGVFYPVEFKNDLLVDGGVLNNFPVDVAKEMGADIVIGVDLRKTFKTEDELTSFGDVAGQLMDIIDLRKNNENRKICDILIEPDLTGYGSSSFTKEAVDTLILRGEAAARACLPQIRALVAKYNLKRTEPSRKYLERTRWAIKEIKFPKEFSDEGSFIKNRMGLKLGDTYNEAQLSDAITRLYAYGNFDKVTYTLTPIDTSYIMNVGLKAKNSSTIRAGFALNTTEAASVHLNFTSESYRTFINLFSVDLKVSTHPQGSITLETHRANFPTVGFKAEGLYTSLSAYTNGKQVGEFDLDALKASLYVYKRFWNVFNVGVGARDEYYYSELFVKYKQALTAQLDEGINGINRYWLASAYMFLTFDNLDDYYIPKSGHEFIGNFTLSSPHDDIKKVITTISLRYRTAYKLSHSLDVVGSLHYRSVYSDGTIPPPLFNYASDDYSSFSSDYMPILGQPIGIGILSDVTTMASVELRFKLLKDVYLAPMIQGISQQNVWTIFNDIRFGYAYGLHFSMNTLLGPVDAKFGTSNISGTTAFNAGLGFRF